MSRRPIGCEPSTTGGGSKTEVKAADEGNAISWGFTFDEIKTISVLRINHKGELTEVAELIVGTRPPQKLMDLTVRRTSGK
jgi:hypothetical protein